MALPKGARERVGKRLRESASLSAPPPPSQVLTLAAELALATVHGGNLSVQDSIAYILRNFNEEQIFKTFEEMQRQPSQLTTEKRD